MSITVGAAVHEDLGVQFGALGPFQARVDGQWQSPPTRQIARVATMLAGWPGEVVEVTRLIDGVWGAKAPATVRNTLQVHVSHLRRMVGRSVVRSQGDGYLLDLAPEAIDVEQFVEAVHDAARLRRREHFARAGELLAHAVDLWRGTPFPDVVDPDLEARRERLTELRDQAREDLLECRLELCRDGFALADIVADAKELVARQPLREKGHVVLVRALAASDRPAEASAAFEAASAHLRDRLGLDPGRTLVDTHARCLTRDPSLLPRAMRSIRLVPSDSRPAVAGTQAGRVREAVVDLGARVVTVIEPDAQVAAQTAATVARVLAEDMPAGVVVIDGPQADLRSVTAAVAEVRSSAAGSGSPEPASGEEPQTSLEGLAIVVAGWAPQLPELAHALDEVPGAVLVVVGDQALDLVAEAVVWDEPRQRSDGPDDIGLRGA